jgi:formylglycine-generating enzyme
MKTYHFFNILIVIALTILLYSGALQSQSISIEMVMAEGGTFLMGKEKSHDASPVHEVFVSSFLIGKFPVTQKEWISVMGYNNSKYQSDDRPVEWITWYEAVLFCNKKSKMEGLEEAYAITFGRDSMVVSVSCDFSKNGYRLPTEAEWEYAAKGGQSGKGHLYPGSDDPDEIAWYQRNSRNDQMEGFSTWPVGLKKPNELGIYDMGGNVGEWCWDWYDPDYYKDAPYENPTGRQSHYHARVRRGGWFGGLEYNLESSTRGYLKPGVPHDALGFRVARTATSATIEEVKEKNIAIKASSSPRDVLPDGKSQVEISAVLYEYIPYSKEPGRPLPGEVLHFSIQESGGVKAGSLSSATALTDAKGVARVMFTAPDNALLGQLQQWARNSTSVKVRSEAHKQEDIAYIGFRSDRSKVFAEPAPGIVSEHCIVPPDRRFPAVIRAYVEDPDMNPLPYTEVLFSIREDNPAGMLRDAGGHEGTQLRVLTDAGGWAAVQYYYAAFGPPPEARTETIEISTKNMSTPMEARVSTGLNLIFESLENAYEGKGIINAGEQIPLRVKIKDAWHPGLNLEEILSFWGPGGVAGEEMLFAKLEVEPLSSVPVYLLDQLKLEQYPGQGFSENMRIRSFKDKGQMNMLWMPDYGLHDYQGYPRIRPMTAGTHYYTAILSLVDDKGQEVFRSRHPARQAHFNLQTGLAADALQIFFISNPFAPHSPEARLLLTTLDLMGFGTVMSVVNALDAINRGATDELYGLLFSEIKGAMLDKVKEGSAYKELAVDLYTGMALAEKVGLEIMKDQTGPLASMDAAILARLKETFSMGHRQLLVLYGDGQQRLYTVEDGEAGREIAVQEGVYIEDQGGEIISLKNGNVSIFLIPEGMEVSCDENSLIKRY